MHHRTSGDAAPIQAVPRDMALPLVAKCWGCSLQLADARLGHPRTIGQQQGKGVHGQRVLVLYAWYPNSPKSYRLGEIDQEPRPLVGKKKDDEKKACLLSEDMPLGGILCKHDDLTPSQREGLGDLKRVVRLVWLPKRVFEWETLVLHAWFLGVKMPKRWSHLQDAWLDCN